MWDKCFFVQDKRNFSKCVKHFYYFTVHYVIIRTSRDFYHFHAIDVKDSIWFFIQKHFKPFPVHPYIIELYHWVIIIELYHWVISLSYIIELYHWVISLSYNIELYHWVISLSYIIELYYRVIALSYIIELYHWVILLS